MLAQDQYSISLNKANKSDKFDEASGRKERGKKRVPKGTERQHEAPEK